LTTVIPGRSHAGSLQHSLSLLASAKDDDGHRENNALDNRFLSVRYQLKGSEKHSSQLSIGGLHSEDTYELAGLPITPQQPTSSSTPQDGGETDMQQWVATFRSKQNSLLSIHSQLQFRERNNDFVLGYAELPTLSREDQTDSNQLRAIDADLALTTNIHDALSWQVGGQRSRTRYEAFRGGLNLVDRSRINRGLLRNEAIFTALDFDSTQLKISLGHRLDKSTLDVVQQQLVQDFSQCPFPFVNCPSIWEIEPEAREHWRNEASELGLLWRITTSLQAYSQFANTFRNPNTDELQRSDEQLKPQQAQQAELGFRWLNANSWLQRLELSTFHYETNNEILYGEPQPGAPGVNLNVEGLTRRSGVELSSQFALPKGFNIKLNSGYIDARIQKTQARIPLTANVTHRIDLQWQSSSEVLAGISYQYVGDRNDGNDFSDNRRFASLKSYQLVNTTLSKAWDLMTVTLGIHNLFNEQYTTAQYSGLAYPMPPRSMTLAIRRNIFDL
ncbi:TonB-dependent receptor, partial [bacterium]|nr:TonB-dependent receptor [bacterium]